MSVLVTGGAGFIGSNLVDELMSIGHRVTVLDDLSTGRATNIERWRRHSSFEFVYGSVLDFPLVRSACEGADWVFHLAAMARIQPSILDPVPTWSTNVVGTGNVLEAARIAGAKRFVYSASSSAYGSAAPIPQREDSLTDCLNPYALSKRVGEEMSELYRKLYGMSTVSLRYFNVYGPRHPEEGEYATVVAKFRRQRRLGLPMTIVGDGEQRRDFTFVGDVVRANVLAAMSRCVHGTVNVGTGKNYSVNEIADAVAGGRSEGDRVHVMPRPGEARETLADNGRLRDELGLATFVPLDVGIGVLDEFERSLPKGAL